MITDKIENARIYMSLKNKRIGSALKYLRLNDFTQFKPGRYEIDGEDIYMLVQEYETKDINICNLEGHQKYIDIQYMVSGTELIGISTLKDQQPINRVYENDCAFFECSMSLFSLQQGMFCIFFPDDLHMPCIKTDGCAKVKKVVIKVLK